MTLLLALLACDDTKISAEIPEDTGVPDTALTDTADTDDTDTVPGGVDSDSAAPTTPSKYAQVSDITVEVHPQIATILEVSWTQDVDADEAWLEFTFEDEGWLQSPPERRAAGRHSEVLLGSPPETEVQLRIANTIDGVTTYQRYDLFGTTGEIPGQLPDPELLIHDPTLAGGERWLLGSVDADDAGWYGGPFWAFILDRQGRYVWYQPVPDNRLALQVQPAWDGGHVVYEGSTWYVWDDTIQPTVTRTTLDQSRYEAETVEGMGFTLDEIEGGHLLYVDVTYDEGGQEQYALVERDADGGARTIWDCEAWLATALGGDEGDCIPNTIIWNPADDTVLWSMFLNDTVVEVDRQTGALLRQWGQLRESWAVDPPEAQLEYQHFPNYTADGTLLVSTHVEDEDGVQVAREFRVDDATETLVEVWSYSSPDHYARYGGEATPTAGGNVLISYGTDGAIAEITPGGEVAWELLIQTSSHTHLVGHLTLLDDLYALNEASTAD